MVSFDEITGDFLGDFITPGSGGLLDPDTLVFGPDGNLYVSSGSDTDPSQAAILRYNGKTGEFIDVFATSASLFRPYGIAFGPDKNLYVSSFRSDEILRYNGKTGKFVDVFASGKGEANGLNGPNGLLFGPDGSLYVTTQGSVARRDGTGGIDFQFDSQVLRYDLTGAASVFVPQATPLPDNTFSFISFLGLAVGPDGNIVTSDFANGIRTYDIQTGELLDTISTNYTNPSGISNNFTGSLIFGPDGNLFTVGFDNRDVDNPIGAVLRFDGTTGQPLPSAGNSGSLFVPPSNQLKRPIGIVFTPPDAVDVPEPGFVIGLLAIGAIFQLQKKQRC